MLIGNPTPEHNMPMKEGSEFERICRAMLHPSFYPHRVSGLEKRETHISTVLLTGEWVYKLKKRVNFQFLDFQTLDARHRFCESEVSLNRRLTTGVYEEVLEVFEDAEGRISLAGPGRVVDYVVKMKQLPQSRSFEALLDVGGVGELEMEALGERLAHFYSSSTHDERVQQFGTPSAIEYNMEENFRQTGPFVESVIPQERWDFIREVSRSFFRDHQSFFEERIQAGCIKDGHGDLRAEHIYFLDSIQIIDCIEFNDRFRYGDVASDLAFLHMDLDRLGHLELSLALLKSVVRCTRDYTLYTLIDFYAAYRALVKVKVACLSTLGAAVKNLRSKHEEVARNYLELAFRYAVQFARPTLYVFCGWPASGKSTLAQRLASILRLPIVQSDRLRKERAGLEPDAAQVLPFGEGLYRPELRGNIYGQMLLVAQEYLEKRRSVILDGTHGLRKWRDEACRLGKDLDANILFVECKAPREAVVQRLKDRELVSSVSDARLQHLEDIIHAFEETTELDPLEHITLNTLGDTDEVLLELLAKAYGLQCVQVRKLLDGMEG